MRPGPRRFAPDILGAFSALLLLSQAVTAAEIGPGEGWCAAIRTLPPGEELVLPPGEYPGGCSIRRGGTPEAPLVIRAKDLQDPPRIVYLGQSTNVVNLYASHVVIQGLQFGPTLPNVDAIRIYTGSDITIEDSRFEDLGSIAIVANHASVRKITIRRNQIVRSKATAMYFGCHNGITCALSELLIEGNYIQGVRAAPGEVGYGMQVKLNSTAIIRDNVIVDTKGPGIMVYGATDLGRVSVVERNFVSGSRTSSGILLGGGPAIVRNNVAVGNAEAGIGFQDYARRGLLRGIVVAHNTVYGNDEGGIVVPAEGRVEAVIVNNAAHARPGTLALPTGRVGVLSMGNVDCTHLPCFMNPGERDFSPVVIGPGNSAGGEWAPRDDYFGRRRGAAPAAGAIEQPAGPISLGVKALPP